MKKKVTIQDIADALGISRNTVSKAINNSEGLADATREKILQKAVEILDGDTAEVLQKRIMEQAEWIILPRAISLIAQGRVVIEGRTTRILPERR